VNGSTAECSNLVCLGEKKNRVGDETVLRGKSQTICREVRGKALTWTSRGGMGPVTEMAYKCEKKSSLRYSQEGPLVVGPREGKVSDSGGRLTNS